MIQLYVLLKGERGQYNVVTDEVRVSLGRLRWSPASDDMDEPVVGGAPGLPLTEIGYMEVKDV